MIAGGPLASDILSTKDRSVDKAAPLVLGTAEKLLKVLGQHENQSATFGFMMGVAFKLSVVQGKYFYFLLLFISLSHIFYLIIIF